MLTQDQLFACPAGTLLDMDNGDTLIVVDNKEGQLTFQFSVTRATSDGLADLVSRVAYPHTHPAGGTQVIDPYPLCKQFNLEVQDTHPPHIRWDSIDALCEGTRVYIHRRLDRQTTAIDGAYPWDVERILERYCDKL